MADDATQAWRAHSGFVAWPTVALAVLAVAAWGANAVGHALGVVPTAVALPLGIALVYVSFTPLHEATHGNVGGSPGWAWLDTAVGWLAGLPLLAPFPAVKAVHLRHHARTNDPVEDPDRFIHGRGWTFVRGALGMWPHYDHVYLTKLSTSSDLARRSRPVVVGALVAIVVVLAALAWAGFGSTVLVAIVMPAWLGVAVLAVLFDWLPHWPHTSQTRFEDTRAIPDRWLDLPLLGQNLHLVHHLWPRVPFYRYRAVFEATRGLLADKGSPVESASTVARRIVRGA